MDWYPEPDETILFRTPLKFATGMAPSVAGARWFRDSERNDIQRELPGWPAGPEFTVHAGGERAARRTVRALAVGVPLVLNVISNAMGAMGSPFGDVPVRGKPREPENEVQDFPVMWAAPGTVARTVPWQLDPSRCPAKYRTDMALTERRLVILGSGSNGLASADVLWQMARDDIADVRRMEYSELNADIKLTFVDDSWIRVTTGSPDNSIKIVQLLQGAIGMLHESDLTEGQRIRVSRFMSDLPKDADPPTFTVLPSGIVRVESRVPVKAGSGLYETHGIFMNSQGAPAQPKPGDL